MTSADPDFSPVRFSTDDLPERDRVGMFREVIGRKIVNLDLDPAADGPFRCEAVLRALPGLGLGSIVTSAQYVRRTKELIAADGNDDLVLTVPVRGTAFLSQLGREATVADGDAFLLRNAEPGLVHYASTARILSLRMPAAALAPMISDLEANHASRIPRDGTAMRLLVAYVDVLQREHAPVTPELRRIVVAHMYDLAALAIGATRDAAAIANGRGVRAARLQQVLAAIHAGFDDPAFSPARAALKLGLSPRYLRELLEETGLSFTDRVLELRLQQARVMLASPRNDRLKVAEIALACGYNEVSYFNRCFRRRFGAAPNTFRGEDSKPE